MAAIRYLVYRLPAIAAILFYWIRIEVYSTGRLLNTPQVHTGCGRT